MSFDKFLSLRPITLTAAAIAAAATMARAQDARPTDARISEAVESEVATDTSIPAALLWVTTDDGIVRMTGISDDVRARDRAAAIARTVRGVRAVVNDIQVVPPESVTTAQLQRHVDAAIEADAVTEAFELDARVENGGKVVLAGKTQSWAERQLAADVVKGVDGVTSVSNRIEVDPPTVRDDEELREEVVGRLRWDVLVDPAAIEVTCDKGVVTLKGAVGSAAERLQAIHDAEVLGVRRVEADELQVAAWATDDMQRPARNVVRTPEQIQSALGAAFRFDPRVAAFAIEPEVDGSRVTLRGAVGTLQARRAAEQDAHNTVGVERVVNRLRVVPGKRRPPEELVADVTAAIARASDLDTDDLDVQARNGIVRITGRVDSNVERARVDHVAAGVRGVIDVENRLAVRDDRVVPFSPYVDAYPVYGFRWYGPRLVHVVRSDEEIARQFELEAWWSPYVTSTRVTALVEDGVATLRGKVATRLERQAAIENAFDAGAVWVLDHTKLEPNAWEQAGDGSEEVDSDAGDSDEGDERAEREDASGEADDGRAPK
ncbi:MAG: BON domain-containing protein [Planctomycetota bacterium]